MTKGLRTILLLGLAVALPAKARADLFHFSTGAPDGLIGTASRPSGPEIETADDFVLTQETLINHATFTGLLPSGFPLGNVNQVEVEIYRIFPADSTNPPDGRVPTRANSPADVEISSRDSALGTLTFGGTILNNQFTAANSVLNGINPMPGQFTGGEGPITGEEVLIDVNFTTPIDLPAGHYFFRPVVGLTGTGDFFWLSAPKLALFPGTTTPDLQSWIRNEDLAPDWLRIGTDITHQGPFDASFSLDGQTVPEPSALIVWSVLGILGITTCWRKRNPRERASSRNT